jgi:hypothetical protein
VARARNIKPSFFSNEELSECSAHARLLFIGLWCVADREGRLEDRPRRIRAEVFPYEPLDVDKLLVELAEAGVVLRYRIDESPYIQILNFLKHQSPHGKERPSTIQAHPDSLFSESLFSESPFSETKGGRPYELPEGLNTEAWEEYEAHRRSYRMPVLKSDLNAKALAELPKAEQLECVRTSVRNGWQGLFPEKHQDKKQAPPPSKTPAESQADKDAAAVADEALSMRHARAACRSRGISYTDAMPVGELNRLASEHDLSAMSA